jgi:hypothetical protein
MLKAEYVPTSRFALPPKEQKVKQASDVCVLLLVPEHIYMGEMYKSNSAKHQTKEKVS